MTMLIPLFFSYTGIRTNIGSPQGNLGLTALVIAVAIAAKVGGAFTGSQDRRVRRSQFPGARLSAKHAWPLVELIVLNVGFDLGILSPALFSTMVIMALVTTVITTPLLKIVLPEYRRTALKVFLKAVRHQLPNRRNQRLRPCAVCRILVGEKFQHIRLLNGYAPGEDKAGNRKRNHPERTIGTNPVPNKAVSTPV